MSQVPNIRLNNGVVIPQAGFGVFQIEPDRTADAVRDAFDAGYRHIDTAQGYGNEEGVGQAIRDSGLPREEVFVTTKLANDRHGYDEAITALDESLQRLGLDHVDLFLIHWPRPKTDRFVETW
jgi:2,5-diketo-D-gluconate reductase A